MGVPVDGGMATVLATTEGLARALVSDGDSVYFVDNVGTKSVPVGGGAVRTIANVVPDSLAVIGGVLYLAQLGGTDAGISTVDTDGGATRVLVREPDGALYPTGCGSDVCWASGPASSASLKKLTSGGSSVVLAEGLTQPHNLVFGGASIFVATGAGGALLYRVPASGGTPGLIQSQAGLSSLALDGTCLYWSSFSGIYSWSRSAADAAPGITE
jgi:hypothetical protein